MVSEQEAHVVERLSKAVPGLRTRRMFGGTGLYAADLFFALIMGDVLYLKVDDESRSDYVSRGMQPFEPFPGKPSKLHYYELPANVLDDPRRLRVWVDKALVAARAPKAKRTVRPHARAGTRKKRRA